MLKIGFGNDNDLVKICHALSTKIRVDILKLLRNETLSVIDISNKLNISFSTVSSNVNVLENAGLILTELHPGKRGTMKVCSKNFTDILLSLNNNEFDTLDNSKCFKIDMPIGQFIDYSIEGSCGMANDINIITEDDSSNFFTPERITAGILWLRKGYVEYNFPKKKSNQNIELLALEFSLEICSEVTDYNDDWPSDISFFVNGTEVASWTSPGDFGSIRGELNPDWWPSTSSQYGILKHIKIKTDGTYLDEIKVSSTTINDLNLSDFNFIKFKIAIKEDAINKGGFNIFGENFGNYQQNICLKVFYEDNN
ncbi:MAG: ArsR/SmtB family transcription factor [Peptostreptococcaceae bacterium]